MEYIKENIKEFSLVNLFQWHNLGYTGEGINIGNTERAYPDHPLFDGKLRIDSGYVFTKKENDHGNKTAHILHQIAPGANIYPISLLNNFSNGRMSGDFVDVTVPLIKEKNISVISSSAWMPSSVNRVTEVLGDMRDKTVLVASAGNNGFDGLGGYGKTEKWMGIGAIGWNDERNEIFLKSYSSRGPELNYTNFSGMAIPNFGEKYPGRINIWDGTSFSGPKHAGLCALVQQFFLENAGRTLSHFEMDKFIMDHLVDLGDEGWDSNYGHGFLVLPDPSTIIINKYVAEYNPNPTPEPPIVIPPKEEPVIPPVEEPTTPDVKEYFVVANIQGYMNAANAINCISSVATLDIGVYYIYKTFTNGAINITKDNTGKKAGWWINPDDNKFAAPKYFDDIDGTEYENAVKDLVDIGILEKDSPTFNGERNVTRGEMVIFLNNLRLYLEKKVK